MHDRTDYTPELTPTVDLSTYRKATGANGIETTLASTLLISAAQLLGKEARILHTSNHPPTPEYQTLINAAEKLEQLDLLRPVERIQPYSDEPFFHFYSVRPRGGGADFFDPVAAMWRAVAENLERLLWIERDTTTKKLVRARTRDMDKPYINPSALAGFSAHQREKDLRLQFDDNTVFGWTPTVSIVSEKRLWCPAGLVSANYVTHHQDEPILRTPVSTGLATGKSKTEAVTKGLLEVIERDALMIQFLNTLSPPRIDTTTLKKENAHIADVLDRFERHNLKVHLLRTPTDFPVAVVNAVVIDHSGKGPAFVLGASADTDEQSAILSALGEVSQIRYGLKKRWQKNVDVRRLSNQDRVVYYAKPEHLDEVQYLLDGPVVEPVAQSSEIHNYEHTLKTLRASLKEKNYEAVYADFTPPELRRIDLHTVYVMSPDLQPLHLKERFPYYGGARLTLVPPSLGYTARSSVGTAPIPFV